MEVRHVDFFLDGGTAVVVTDAGAFYLDRRLSSKTPNALYNDYPSNEGAARVDARKADVVAALKEYLKNPDLIYRAGIERIIEDLN